MISGVYSDYRSCYCIISYTQYVLFGRTTLLSDPLILVRTEITFLVSPSGDQRTQTQSTRLGFKATMPAATVSHVAQIELWTTFGHH